VWWGADEETVGKRAKGANMVIGGREEEHVLVDYRLSSGRVGRGGTTTERLPLLLDVLI
jgi:hypothetical protein